MLVGTDDYVRVVFVWEETGVPGGNLPGLLGDHITILHATLGNIEMDRHTQDPIFRKRFIII